MRLFERLVLLLSYLVGTVEPRSVGGSASKMFFGRANSGYIGDKYDLSDMCNGLAVLVSHRQFCDMLAVRELAIVDPSTLALQPENPLSRYTGSPRYQGDPHLHPCI